MTGTPISVWEDEDPQAVETVWRAIQRMNKQD